VEMLEKVQKMLEKYPLCDHCLGRQFALLGYGLDNQKRGEALKLLLTMEAHQLTLSKDKAGISLLKILTTNGNFEMADRILRRTRRKVGEKRKCHLCEGKLDSLQEPVDKIVEMLKDYEYSTFLVGIELPTEIEEREDELKAEFEIKHGESLRNEFSRGIGKKIVEATDRIADYKKPDIVILVDPFTGHIKLQVNPWYVAGRYRKLIRGIPQSTWFCLKCRGKGCENCGWTGKMYAESIEELIVGPVLERTGGEEATFHATGREDVDARMLGRGRPFVAQIKTPKRRLVDLQELAEAINRKAEGKIQVFNLRFADKDTVRKLKKREIARKLYRAIVEFDRPVSDEELKTLEEALTAATVRQQTPRRVLRRRVDREREKHIYKVDVKRIAPNRVKMRILCQGGLYIKELITGDEGRTEPNVAKIVNAKAEPLELDVLNMFTGR